MRFIGSAVLVLALSVGVLAQSRPKFKLDAYDGAMVGTMIGDEFSLQCQHCRERNPLPTGARLGIKGGVFALTKFVEYKCPDKPWTLRAFKLAITGLYATVIVHNLRLK